MASRRIRQVYLVAGEASGDALGAALMRALKGLRPDIVFHGVGGAQMTAEGLHSLFPMEEISFMGFAEVLPHIPAVLKRVKWVAEDIRRVRPDAVVTIDAQAFSKRVAKKLQRERKKGLKLIQYVAPSVWAYKPERMAWFKKLYDRMLCLLPFEAPYAAAVKLDHRFVGHPIMQEVPEGDRASFRQKHQIPMVAKVMGLFPGSRKGEVLRHLPLFRQVVKTISERHTDLRCVLLVAPQLMEEVEKHTADWPVPLTLVTEIAARPHMLAASDIALTKSGTVTLELARAGLPMVMVHKVNPVSMWLIRRMIRVRFACLLNLLQEQEVVPEILQEFAKPVIIARELERLLIDPDAREWQRRQVNAALQKLWPGEMPATAAARAVIESVEQA